MSSRIIGEILHKFSSDEGAFIYATLLKIAFKADFEIPESFTKSSTLMDARSLFDDWYKRQNLSKYQDPTRLIELMMFKHPLSGLSLLPSESQSSFNRFVIEKLCEISFEKWPNKSSIIISLSRSLNLEWVEFLHYSLKNSRCDELTPKIGSLFMEVFRKLPDTRKTKNLCYISPAINRLQKLLPGLTAFAVEGIFKVYFPLLEDLEINVLSKDGPWTRRLQFSGDDLLVIDDLFICRQDRYLMAYNCKDGSPVWSTEVSLQLSYFNWCQKTSLYH